MLLAGAGAAELQQRDRDHLEERGSRSPECRYTQEGVVRAGDGRHRRSGRGKLAGVRGKEEEGRGVGLLLLLLLLL